MKKLEIKKLKMLPRLTNWNKINKMIDRKQMKSKTGNKLNLK